MTNTSFQKRQQKQRTDSHHPTILSPESTDRLARVLSKQIGKEIFEKKYAPTREILILVGAGAFLAASAVLPGLPRVLKPFLNKKKEYEAWKRFNIPYLKRTLKRLEQQKLVEIDEEEEAQVVKITEEGKKRILKYALETLTIKKPRVWDGKWRLVSYDVPRQLKNLRDTFRDYLKAWGFYELHKSVYLHAYPCEKEVEFLREYLGIGKYVRIFVVSKIENDEPFRKFFGV